MARMAQTDYLWEKILTVLSRACIIAGIALVCLSLALFIARYNPYRLAFTAQPIPTPHTENETVMTSEPIRISLPDISIDLPIVRSTIHDQKWETSSQGVSYLDLSPIPGQKGNSILYGHNWTNLLGPLVHAKPGQRIYISYADGSVSTFKIQATALVSPQDTSILAPSNDIRVTIYTCAGFMDSQRFVVTARKA